MIIGAQSVDTAKPARGVTRWRAAVRVGVRRLVTTITLEVG
jgi:hypothetical protein